MPKSILPNFQTQISHVDFGKFAMKEQKKKPISKAKKTRQCSTPGATCVFREASFLRKCKSDYVHR